jgi:DNA-binding beta-propeller fold protein YncE
MRIGSGEHTYNWIEHWASIPDTASGKANGRTHGVVVTSSGNVMVFNQANPGVLTFNPDGQLIGQWGDRFDGAHGMSRVVEGDEEFLWLTDQNTAEVVKTTLDGKSVMNIAKPDHPVYREGGKYTPTWVAVNEQRFGGNGDVWVTDGYGSNLVHHYDQGGKYLGSIDGTEGNAGAFKCSHGIMFSYRRGTPELYIADRSNQRLQVYDAEGKYLRVVEGQTHSPCGFVFLGKNMYVPELFAGVKIFDGDDRLVANLGDNRKVTEVKGWPNLAGTQHVQAGKFNSPHGMAVAPSGDIYVVEWIIGGRITKLAKV